MAVAASVLEPEMPVIVSTIFLPDTGKMMLSIENISMDGARELVEFGTMVSLKESNEAVASVPGGAR
jgi:hypothetical protein